MNHDDFTRHGADLLERVQQQVDAPGRLRQLEHHDRNSRMVAVAVAAVAVAFFALLGGLWWLSDDVPPVDQPETTTTTLRSLPVETSIVLLDQFTIDQATGACSGSGELSALTEGRSVRVVDDLSGETVVTVQLQAGVTIGSSEVERLGGSLIGPDACRLVFETGLGDDEFQDREIDVGLDGVGYSGIGIGLRLTIFYGGNL